MATCTPRARVTITRRETSAVILAKIKDLCDTALDTYDAEQTSRVSSCLWGAGCPAKATSDDHDSNRTFEVRAPPWMARCRDGLVSPEPRMAGGDPVAWPAAHVRWPRMAECPCSQGWREGTLCATPCLGSLTQSLLVCLRKDVAPM